MATPHLTAMRQSLWDAIENWPAFNDVFKQMWKFESVGAMREQDITPSRGKLPALAIVPSSGESGWVTNQEQEITYSVEIVIYTDRIDVRRGELLWQEMVRCFWQSAPSGTTRTYIAAATNDVMTASGPTATEIGEITAWRWPVTLKLHWNPRLDTDLLTI